MPALAPWENPNLPASFAEADCEIEGHPRRFALWRWERRLVWRDLRFAQLWWATLNDAENLDDWERAIEAGRFGRASSQSHKYEGYGPRLNLPRRVRFKPDDYGKRCKFLVLCDSCGRGIARQSDEGEWWIFPAPDDKRPLPRVQQGLMKQPLWWPGLQIPHSSNAVWSGYAARFLSRLPPDFLRVLQAGEGAEILCVAHDLTLWHHLSHWQEKGGLLSLAPHSGEQQNLIARLPSLFGLKPYVRSTAFVTDWPFKILEIGAVCERHAQGINWQVQRWRKFPTQIPTTHELLELQLRLRDALRPILTSSEIEEILAPPARF